MAVVRGTTLAQYDLGIRGNSKPARLFESSPICYPELEKLLKLQKLRIFSPQLLFMDSHADLLPSWEEEVPKSYQNLFKYMP